MPILSYVACEFRLNGKDLSNFLTKDNVEKQKMIVDVYKRKMSCYTKESSKDVQKKKF